MNNIIDALQWRYATKQFDTSKKLTEGQVAMLLEALRLSPSSAGMQPWKFVVVTNEEVRAKLRAVAWDQPQVTDASHLVVLAVKNNVTDETVDEFIALLARVRGVAIEDLSGYSAMIKGMIAGKSQAEITEWATRQVYLAGGMLLAAAAVEGVDACPMEGFNAKQFDEILGLAAHGIESRVVIALGYRSSDDRAQEAPKARFSKEEVIIEIK